MTNNQLLRLILKAQILTLRNQKTEEHLLVALQVQLEQAEADLQGFMEAISTDLDTIATEIGGQVGEPLTQATVDKINALRDGFKLVKDHADTLANPVPSSPGV